MLSAGALQPDWHLVTPAVFAIAPNEDEGAVAAHRRSSGISFSILHLTSPKKEPKVYKMLSCLKFAASFHQHQQFIFTAAVSTNVRCPGLFTPPGLWPAHSL